jgi:hypothetical protein
MGRKVVEVESCSGAHLWIYVFDKGRDSSQRNLLRGSLGGKFRLDSAEHHRNHPSRSKFVGGLGVRISMPRGATTEALNSGIDGPAIDVNNDWRKVEAAKEKMPRYSMRQRYTQVFQDLKYKLMFSLGI